jgi:hypothetical protein
MQVTCSRRTGAFRQQRLALNGRNAAHLPPGSHGQSVGGVSDRMSAKARKQVARDVTNCRKCEGATG